MFANKLTKYGQQAQICFVSTQTA